MAFVVQRADYLAAVDWVADLMEETDWDKLNLPTPCKEFDVRRLMGHLIGTAYRGLGTATGEPTTHVPHVVSDVADDQLPEVYRDLAGELRATWSLIGRTDTDSQLGEGFWPMRSNRSSHRVDAYTPDCRRST